MTAFTAREQLAWLMYCYQQGYADPADRAVLSNWMRDDPATLTEDDLRLQRELLAMADEVLALLPGQADEWKADPWWRVVRDIPSPGRADIWSESSDEDAERAALATAPWPARLERWHRRVDHEWRAAG